MSIESFEAFMNRLHEDAAMREELRAQAPDGLTFDQLAQAASARGFAFKAEELADAVDGELSDEQLESVAGGAGFIKISGVSDLKSMTQQIVDLSNMYKLGSTLFKF